jgi:hypothetical protein
MTEDQKTALVKFREVLSGQAASVRESAEYIKSDEIVDDDSCDAVVTGVQVIVQEFNRVAAAFGLPALNVPPALESSPYQDDDDGDGLEYDHDVTKALNDFEGQLG